MKKIFLSLLLCAIFVASQAQQVIYADVNKADVQRMNFEILGKLANNYLVYKEIKGKHRISVYDENMQLLEEVPINILPKRSDLLDVSFFPNGRFANLVYQYQVGDVVFLKGVQVEANGHILQQPVVMDTTMIAYKAENKIYNLLTNNSGSRIASSKINKKDRELYRFAVKQYGTDLQPISESRFTIPMQYKGDYLSGYSITNDGSFAFVKYNRQPNGNISEAYLIEKPAAGDEYKEHALNIGHLFLDDIKLMVDDKSNRYLLSSFYSKEKRGDIDGLYVLGMNKITGITDFEKTTEFTDDFKRRVKGKSNPKNAFNNFFINNIIVHNDGSFTVGTEAMYTSNNWDRWGFWGSPYGGMWGPGMYGGYWGGWGGIGPWGGWGWGWRGYWSPYAYYSPFFYRSYWWGGWGPGWYGGGGQQFNAGNIALVSFDSEGNKTWDNVMVKSQSENNTDASLSYQVLMRDGEEMNFLINDSKKISALQNIVVSNNGGMQAAKAAVAKDKHIDFMPRYGKQVSATEIIIPYSYKKNISFAKVKL